MIINKLNYIFLETCVSKARPFGPARAHAFELRLLVLPELISKIKKKRNS